ncbi:MAG: UvrD-helicase domain-containing protein [Gammaproteobacteria bacterium]|nr:UvrD-helicase domain-containing protein [Gammaproteobacteria bacterium]
MTDSRNTLRLAVDAATDQSVRDEVTSPHSSYIVQAPAGSGKTTLLVSRYLRLLGIVNQPEEILAITFTRKAAHEMKSRVLLELTQGESEVAQAALERSRQRHWDLQLNPQRLKIQTIDSFAYSLVQRMPYESQLSLDYQRLDDSSLIYQDATAQFLGLINSDDAFADDIASILALLDNDYTKALRELTTMLAKRQHWIAPIRTLMAEVAKPDGIKHLTRRLTQVRTNYLDALIDEARAVIPLDLYVLYGSLAEHSASYLMKEFFNLQQPSDWRILANILVTQKGTLRNDVTVRQGFPPKIPAKESCKYALERTRILGLTDIFARLRTIPDRNIPETHTEALESLAIVLSTLIEQLNHIFRQREIVDFTELSFAAQRALSSDDQPSELALALDYRISHILIDEYQDTSQAQFDLLDRVMSSWNPDSGNTFFAVGDPMQSIYGFRDADLKLFQDTFEHGLHSVQVEPRQLTSNFRSSANVVDWVNQLCPSIFGDKDDSSIGAVAYARSIPTQMDLEGEVEIIVCTNDPDSQQEAREVAKKISQISVANPDESIGMLVQIRTRLPVYFNALREEGLTWRGVEIAPLSDVPVVRDLFSLLQAINDNRNRLAWLSFFRSPLCGMTLPDLEILSSLDTGSEMLNCNSLSNLGRRILNRIRKPFNQLEGDRKLTLRSQLERIWFRLGGNDAYNEPDTLINAERFLTLVESCTRGEIRMDELWTRIESEYATEEADSADVEIMTIHKAKGLEFDHVILPDLNRQSRSDSRDLIQWQPYDRDLLIALNLSNEEDSLYSWLQEEQKTKRENELKRLLYVAITRARKSLTLFGSCKEEFMRAKKGSLFAQIALVLHDATVVKGSEIHNSVETSTSTMLTRLDPDYMFEPNSAKFKIPSSLQSARQIRQADLSPIGFQRELALGNLVHRELHRIAETQQFSLDVIDNERTTLWRNRLRAEGVDGSNLPWVIERAQQHLTRVLDDKTGRWILDGKHQLAQSEAPFSTWIDDSVRNIVIDRTFVDSEDTRWIIDYKTAMIGREEKEELERFAVRRYSDQMALYARVLRRVEDRPVRCAVYLTDIPKLVELEASS